jgi:hypothetical protein
LQRLFDDEALLRSKLLEECEELLAAKDNKEVHKHADAIIYMCMYTCYRDTT